MSGAINTICLMPQLGQLFGCQWRKGGGWLQMLRCILTILEHAQQVSLCMYKALSRDAYFDYLSLNGHMHLGGLYVIKCGSKNNCAKKICVYKRVDCLLKK